jgi:predicted dehydrogenase
VAAIVDTNLAAASALARGRTRAFTDLDACLEACKVDVVHVCTPVGPHVGLARRALEAGCHALVEKPLAPTLAETRSLLAAAEASGLLLAPVHQFPFQRGFRRILAARARLGELVRVSYRTCSAGGDGKPASARRAILTEILPHPVSLFLRLLPALDVSSLELQVFDDHDLVLAGSSGGIALDVFISLRGRPTRNELEVIGTDGSAWADLYGGYALFEGGRVSRVAKIGRPFRLGVGLVGAAGVNVAARASRWEPAYPGLRELIREFHAAAANRAEPPVAGTEALAAAELMDAVSA